MTFTWISNSKYDIFEKLLLVPDYLIETPLAYENILIKNYVKTPLSHGFYKNEIYGNNVQDFETYVNDETIKRLVFSTDKVITINDINGIIELLSIVLCKKYCYKIDNVMHEFVDGIHYFTPKNNLHDLYTIDNISINIDTFIGYVPLLSGVYLDSSQKNTQYILDIQTSDLLFLCNIDKYHYEVITGDIVVIKIGSDDYYELKAQQVENAVNDIDIFASEVQYYKEHCFLMHAKYKDIMQEFIEVYHFEFVKKAKNGDFCYKHDVLDKRWVLGAIDAINNNELPTITFYSNMYEVNADVMAKLQYSVLRAVDEINNDVLSRHLHQISVASDGTITIPVLNLDDVETIKVKVNLYMKNNVYLYKIKNESDGLNTASRVDGISFVFKINDQWIFASNVKTKIYTTTQTLSNIRPLKDLQLPMIDLKPTEKMDQEQIDYLWVNGKLLSDWAYYYYINKNKLSKVPLLNADLIEDPFSGN